MSGMYTADNFTDENAKFASIQLAHPHKNYIHEDDLNDADIAILCLKKVLLAIYNFHLLGEE